MKYNKHFYWAVFVLMMKARQSMAQDIPRGEMPFTEHPAREEIEQHTRHFLNHFAMMSEEKKSFMADRMIADYENFNQMSDEEKRHLIEQRILSREAPPAPKELIDLLIRKRKEHSN